jgi:hypothetical protein
MASTTICSAEPETSSDSSRRIPASDSAVATIESSKFDAADPNTMHITAVKHRREAYR